MKQKIQMSILTILLFSIICGFTAHNNEIKTDQTNETKAVNSTYTLRALINSTTAADMTVTESAGTVTIITTNNTATASDSSYIILSNDFTYASDYTCTIAPDQKTWLVPIDGGTPIQIADLGSGGGGGGSETYGRWFCPCHDACNCNNVCEHGKPIVVNGKTLATCKQTIGAEVCTTSCCVKWCKVAGVGGPVLGSIYAGSAYIVRASTLVLNGTTY